MNNFLHNEVAWADDTVANQLSMPCVLDIGAIEVVHYQLLTMTLSFMGRLRVGLTIERKEELRIFKKLSIAFFSPIV